MREKQISDSEIIYDRNPKKIVDFFHRKSGLYERTEISNQKTGSFLMSKNLWLLEIEIHFY